MKKYLSIVFILLATILCTISYAKVWKHADTLPVVVKAVKPFYPLINYSMMREGKSAGKVVLKFVVTKDGKVRDPKVVVSIPKGVFDKSALDAIKKYRFKPATRNGKPVDCIVNLPIVFSVHGVKSPYDVYKATDKGLKYSRVGEYKKAIKAFTVAICITDKYSPSYAGRGIAYGNLGEYKKAISDFNMAIKRSPKNGLYFKLRGQVYSKLKDYHKAYEDYSNAIERDPDMVDAYFERGEVLRESGKYKEAIDDYTRVIKLNKKYVQAYNVRAVSYNKLNDMKDMCLDLKKACELGDCRGFNYAKKAGKCIHYSAGAK